MVEEIAWANENWPVIGFAVLFFFAWLATRIEKRLDRIIDLLAEEAIDRKMNGR